MSSFLRQVPDWNRIKSILSSRSRYSSKYGSYESGSKDSRSEPKKATYRDLDSWRQYESRVPGYEMGSGKTFVAALQTGKQDNFSETGIHLQHDIEQQSQEGDAP